MSVYNVPMTTSAALAKLANRNMQIQCTIQDKHIWFASGETTVQVETIALQEPALRLWVDGVRTENTMVNLGSAPALDTIRLGGDAGTAYSGALDELWIAQTAITLDEAALARYCPL